MLFKMKPGLLVYLGTQVRVKVDRPLGSVHPHHTDIVYPVGGLAGTLSGDGHPFDASLLGWSEAVQEAWRTVIAVVIRHADREDKLLVSRRGTRCMDGEIISATRFQEPYFHTTLAR